MRKEKSSFLIAYAFTTVIFDSDTGGYVSSTLEIKKSRVINWIISGDSRGISPDVIIRNWECTICHKEYEKCMHEEGVEYSGTRCQLIARNIEFSGVSLVDEPKDPRCRVNDLLVISQIKGAKLFEWYGFELHNDKIRFKNIKEAHKKKLISSKTAFAFSEFFSVNLFGKVDYVEKN